MMMQEEEEVMMPEAEEERPGRTAAVAAIIADVRFPPRLLTSYYLSSPLSVDSPTPARRIRSRIHRRRIRGRVCVLSLELERVMYIPSAPYPFFPYER